MFSIWLGPCTYFELENTDLRSHLCKQTVALIRFPVLQHLGSK